MGRRRINAVAEDRELSKLRDRMLEGKLSTGQYVKKALKVMDQATSFRVTDEPADKEELKRVSAGK